MNALRPALRFYVQRAKEHVAFEDCEGPPDGVSVEDWTMYQDVLALVGKQAGALVTSIRDDALVALSRFVVPTSKSSPKTAATTWDAYADVKIAGRGNRDPFAWLGACVAANAAGDVRVLCYVRAKGGIRLEAALVSMLRERRIAQTEEIASWTTSLMAPLAILPLGPDSDLDRLRKDAVDAFTTFGAVAADVAKALSAVLPHPPRSPPRRSSGRPTRGLGGPRSHRQPGAPRTPWRRARSRPHVRGVGSICTAGVAVLVVAMSQTSASSPCAFRAAIRYAVACGSKSNWSADHFRAAVLSFQTIGFPFFSTIASTAPASGTGRISPVAVVPIAGSGGLDVDLLERVLPDVADAQRTRARADGRAGDGGNFGYLPRRRDCARRAFRNGPTVNPEPLREADTRALQR